MNEQGEVITVIGNLACCSLGVYISYEERHRTAGAARALPTTPTLLSTLVASYGKILQLRLRVFAGCRSLLVHGAGCNAGKMTPLGAALNQ